MACPAILWPRHAGSIIRLLLSLSFPDNRISHYGAKVRLYGRKPLTNTNKVISPMLSKGTVRSYTPLLVPHENMYWPFASTMAHSGVPSKETVPVILAQPAGVDASDSITVVTVADWLSGLASCISMSKGEEEGVVVIRNGARPDTNAWTVISPLESSGTSSSYLPKSSPSSQENIY